MAIKTRKFGSEYRRVHAVAQKVTKNENKISALVKRDNDANRRLQLHIIYITIGLLITIALSFWSSAIALHFGPALSGVPSIIQELTDWVKRW